MPIDDKLEKLVENISRESDLDLAKETLSITIASIPFGIGSAIGSILSGQTKRLIFEKMNEILKAMKARLEQVDESKIDKTFFESEEFQTLFALTLQQLQTTHDTAKLRMLACGLANSGVHEFSSEERKELFTRILRDLSPSHIKYLQSVVPKAEFLNYRNLWPTFVPFGETLAMVQALKANGLVQQMPSSEIAADVARKMQSKDPQQGGRLDLDLALGIATTRYFRITQFGIDFLNYFGELDSPAAKDSAQKDQP